MTQQFYGNGKLLLTGEYSILDGAVGLAIPTVFGQHMSVSETKTPGLHWKSMTHENTCWIDITFHLTKNNGKAIISHPQNTEASPEETGLIKILTEAHRLNPSFLNESVGYSVTTTLTFPKHWGLGSSSTLIAMVAEWAKVNPYTLLQNTFTGSGYDIACATHNTPILFQLKEKQPNSTAVSFNPSFKHQLYFVYLNQKQNSREGIALYKNATFNKRGLADSLTTISTKALAATSVTEFSNLIESHEQLLSNTLLLPTVKQRLFPDFNGTLKSLGAWGGDFIMAISKENPTDYFKDKGYNTILSYDDMAL